MKCLIVLASLWAFTTAHFPYPSPKYHSILTPSAPYSPPATQYGLIRAYRPPIKRVLPFGLTIGLPSSIYGVPKPPPRPTIVYAPPPPKPVLIYGPPPPKPVFVYGPPPPKPVFVYRPPPPKPVLVYGPPPPKPILEYGPPPPKPVLEYGPPPPKPIFEYGPPPPQAALTYEAPTLTQAVQVETKPEEVAVEVVQVDQTTDCNEVTQPAADYTLPEEQQPQVFSQNEATATTSSIPAETPAEASAEYGLPDKSSTPFFEYTPPEVLSNEYGPPPPPKPVSEYGPPPKPVLEYGPPPKPVSTYGAPSAFNLPVESGADFVLADRPPSFAFSGGFGGIQNYPRNILPPRTSYGVPIF